MRLSEYSNASAIILLYASHTKFLNDFCRCRKKGERAWIFIPLPLLTFHIHFIPQFAFLLSSYIHFIAIAHVPQKFKQSREANIQSGNRKENFFFCDSLKMLINFNFLLPRLLLLCMSEKKINFDFYKWNLICQRKI